MRQLLRSEDIHARISWPALLTQLIGEDNLPSKRKPGACPACGGHDRFFFDNRRGRGDFHCRHCGPGDGFKLLMLVTGEDFATVRKRVIEIAGLEDGGDAKPTAPIPPRPPEPPAKPTRRVWDLINTACAVEHCDDVRRYIANRRISPLPARHGLKAHASAEYWHEGENVGRFPALIAPVRDIAGDLVTVHITYLKDGAKLAEYPAKKLLSALTNRIGCAARLVPLDGEVLGIGEGLESSLSAGRIHTVPTWAALNAGLLAKFEPPATIRRLLIFADRDEPGLDAAHRLAERLKGRIATEIRTPNNTKDWNDHD